MEADMTRIKKLSILTALAALVMAHADASAYEITFGETSTLEIKGDTTYTAKVRTEDPDPDLVKESKGNSNFEKGDIVNNKGILRMETTFNSTYLTLFGKGEAFYDHVYNDDDKYPEGTDTDEAKRWAAYRYEAQEYYFDFHAADFMLRAGRQIIEWGDSVAPINAPGVGVINVMDGSRIGAPGYSPRDYKVPALSAWALYQIMEGLSVEGVYAPDFDPRYCVPVVGTYASFMDIGGFGGPEQIQTPIGAVPYYDRYPTKFKDMQQYGGAVRNVFSSLGNLEVGLYYFHYLDWAPIVEINENPIYAFSSYEELDMYGITLCGVINSLGLDLQLNGELAYRPNEPAQVNKELIGQEMPAGSVQTRTLNWVIGGMQMFNDIFGFTPWTVQFVPLFECYGGYNLDYNNIEELDEDDEGLYFKYPENIAYYMFQIGFETSDMIDNTKLSLTFQAMGSLHKQERSIHTLTPSITAKYGDHAEMMLGYEYKMGTAKQATGTPNTPDRDAFTFRFTWYYM